MSWVRVRPIHASLIVNALDIVGDNEMRRASGVRVSGLRDVVGGAHTPVQQKRAMKWRFQARKYWLRGLATAYTDRAVHRGGMTFGCTT